MLLTVAFALAAEPTLADPAVVSAVSRIPSGSVYAGDVSPPPALAVNGRTFETVALDPHGVNDSLRAVPGYVPGPNAVLFGTPMAEVTLYIDGVRRDRGLAR